MYTVHFKLNSFSLWQRTLKRFCTLIDFQSTMLYFRENQCILIFFQSALVLSRSQRTFKFPCQIAMLVNVNIFQSLLRFVTHYEIEMLVIFLFTVGYRSPKFNIHVP